MIGAIVAGLVCVTAICADILCNRTPIREIDLGGEPEQIELPAFASLTVDTRLDGRVLWMGNLKGVAVEERDSVAQPYMLTVASLKECVKTAVKGDTLNLNIDLNTIADTLNSAHVIKFSEEGSWLVKVIVPKGTLREVSNYWGTLKLIGIGARDLTVRTDNRLELASCRIDSLYISTRTDRLKLSDSSVGCLLAKAPYDLKIDCCDGSGEIGSLELKSYHSCDLNITKANIRSIKWNPQKPGPQLRIKSAGSYEISGITPGETTPDREE